MQTFSEIAGTYYFKSPYHKNKKLPFNIESDGYVSTVEYKGWDAYLVQSYYPINSLIELINTGYIKLGRVDFPRYKRN